MKAIANLSTQKWTFEYQDFYGALPIRIGIASDSEVTQLSNVSFGYEIYTGSDLITSESFPPENIVYVSTDQEIMTTSYFEKIKIGRPYTLKFWIDDFGKKFDSTFDIMIPKPEQPFESWIWNEDISVWESPVPYPNDGEYYLWNEELGSWVLYSEMQDLEVEES